jgi:uncharacterized membrane protein YkvA (DUF1232 family)
MARPESLEVAGGRVNLSNRWRYLRLARILVKLPTYLRLVWGMMRDPRTPIGLKAILVAALAYVAMPVDLIPDVIPILGQADDLTVLLITLDLFIHNAPADVRAEHAQRARSGTADLDRDLGRLRALLGDRFDRIGEDLPGLLERYGQLRNPDEVKRALASWGRRRAGTIEPKELE